MQKKNFNLQRIIILFLLLLGNSNLLFSANVDLIKSIDQENQQELMSSTEVGGDIILFDSILPFQKSLLFQKASLTGTDSFDARIVYHTITSLIYIKRSSSIFPNLGVKEMVFPFHIFLEPVL